MWVVVEKLAETDNWTVATADERLRDRGSLERAVRDLQGSRKAATEILRQLLRFLDDLSEVRAGFYDPDVAGALLMGTAVYGPEQEQVWAANVWLSPESELPSSRPPWDVRAFSWSGDQRFVRARDPLNNMPRRLTAPEATSTLTIEDAEDFFSALLGTSPELNRVSADGETGANVKFSTRLICARDSMNPTEWRGLLLRSHAAKTVETVRAIDELSVDSLMKVLPKPVHLALMDVAKMRLVTWLTDPVTGVQWKGLVDDRDTPHPEDVETIFAYGKEFLQGRSSRGEIAGVRLRARGGGWVVTDIRATLLTPTATSVRLLLVSFVVVGFTSDPDPVAVNDSGHPGLTV
jgi:hypothetical protein